MDLHIGSPRVSSSALIWWLRVTTRITALSALSSVRRLMPQGQKMAAPKKKKKAAPAPGLLSVVPT